MGLCDSINQYLTDELLAQLANESALPVAGARATTAAAVPVLVRQLAQSTDSDELNARWDMCRQLYLSQLLTQPQELLRTDLGWPDRRHYLTRKVLNPSQVAALIEPASQPAQASTLLGYLTIITLAVIGEQASKADLAPAELGTWLTQQQVPNLLPLGGVASRPTQPAARLATTAKGTSKLAVASALGGVVLAGLAGSYFWLGMPANAAPPTALKAAEVASPPATPALAPVAEVAAATPAPVLAAAAAPAAVAAVAPAAVHAKPAALAVAAVGLRDTVGNAALARQVGGKYSVSAGRYLKGEGQPLIIKLVNRATLTVGINSTESLLYKRLAQPTLRQPTDIPVDRLSFDLGQARLGAEGAQQLGSLASLLKTFPKTRLVVVGHANNHEAQAMRLGLQRANLAVEELVKQGIPADRLQAQGMLSTELPSDNDSAEKKALLQGISLKLSRL